MYVCSHGVSDRQYINHRNTQKLHSKGKHVEPGDGPQKDPRSNSHAPNLSCTARTKMRGHKNGAHGFCIQSIAHLCTTRYHLKSNGETGEKTKDVLTWKRCDLRPTYSCRVGEVSSFWLVFEVSTRICYITPEGKCWSPVSADKKCRAFPYHHREQPVIWPVLVSYDQQWQFSTAPNKQWKIEHVPSKQKEYNWKFVVR